jgi:SAM-dependent methyltransferase
MKLNLGAGQFKKEGYVNVDINPELHPDIVHNLDVFPYPFKEKTFERIEGDHVLEHLKEPFKTMGELQRIAKPGAVIVIRVPHFSRGFTHTDHKRGFDVTFPYYFDPEFKGGYSGIPLKIRKVRLTWFAQPYLKKPLMPKPLFYAALMCGAFLNFFANLHPYVCSRIWCFWVGGFEEVSFEFEVQ